MPQTVLVTGGTGFVGGWTIIELLKRGYRVRTTVRDLSKEAGLRAAIGQKVDPGDRLSVMAADLTSDAGWPEAVAGCEAVLHIASPLGAADHGDADKESALIEAAEGGTLRVLKAAVDAGVPRVVMTSSAAACTPEPLPGRPIDETDWTDPAQPDLSAYRKSKVLAELAAWKFMEGKATTLTTIMPGAIFGPVLSRGQLGSVGIIQRLLNGQPPAMPRLGFNITDVRDLAELHIRAMETPDAAGERFIAMGDALWYKDVAQALKAGLGAKAAKVPTRGMPDIAFKALAVASPQMKALLPLLGRTQRFSTDKARRVLGYAPRPARDTVIDCGASLVD